MHSIVLSKSRFISSISLMKISCPKNKKAQNKVRGIKNYKKVKYKKTLDSFYWQRKQKQFMYIT